MTNSSILEQLQPLLSERNLLRSPATATKLVEWVELNASLLARDPLYGVVIARAVLYANALKSAIGNPDRQVEVGGTLLDFLDGVRARESMGTRFIMDFYRDSGTPAPGEWLDDGELIVECPKCHAPAIMQEIPGETMYMHRIKIMPHGYDSLEHCMVPKEEQAQLL